MLNKMVNVTMRGLGGKETKFSGKVVDTNNSGKLIWVETDEDTIIVNLANPNINTVEVVEEKSIHDATCEKIENWLEQNDLTWDAFGGSDATEYYIHGDVYNVCLVVELDEDGELLPFYLDTTHKERYSKEDSKPSFDPYKDPSGKSTANRTSRKTLSGAFSYIDKYCIYK